MKKLLILLVITSSCSAQGFNHVNQAFQTFTLNGQTVMKPIANAVVTVCNGSSVPPLGSTCGGLASIFSNVTLTTSAQNPTNADSNGNYTFYVAPGNYVVSVSGTNLVTYSYPITASCQPSSSCTLTGSFALPLNLSQGGFTNNLAASVTGARTWTLQDTSDTFVFRATTDTLTNKTLTTPAISSPSTTGTDAGAETFNNKTFDISLNTLKTATNTAAHVPRNNGTQYVDAQLAAADLSNGVTGSGAVVLTTSPTIATPTINGASTGTGVQGTDTKLLTSGTVSGTSSFLCTDANGGATTSGCPFTTIKTATAAGCTTGTTNGATCTTTVSWPAPNFPDTNYKVTCQGTGTITGYPFNIGLSKAVGSVTVTTSNGASAQAVASSNANIECIGVE